MDILTFENVSFTYALGERPALRDINLSFAEIGFYLICGPSGSGKSTLLRMMKKNLIPGGDLSGSVAYMGTEISEMDNLSCAAEIGFVQQNPAEAIVTDVVWHELAFGLENLGLPNEVMRRRVAEMAAFFGIESWYDKPTGELSGGQQQMLNLASVMVMQPKVLLLDEPTSQLDPLAAGEFLQMLARINRELGTTVILTEHRLEELFAMADRIVIMNKGNIDQIDTPQNCYRNPKTESVAALLGAGNAVHGTASADGAEAVRLGGVSCMAAGREGICREDPVSIRFRAENAVWRGDQNEGNGFPVTVEYSSFEGDFYRVMAKTAEGEPLCFLSREFLKKGVRGYVAVEKSRLYVYGRECA